MPDRQIAIPRAPGLWPLSWTMGLTMLRLALLPVFLYVLLADTGAAADDNRRWAVAVFAVMAVTDKLDGYLARKLNQTSKLGAALDPIADKLLIACAVIVLSIPRVAPEGHRIPLPLVFIIYGKDLVVAFGALALLSLVGKVTIDARPLGKLGTFLQLSTVIATLLAPDVARLGERYAVLLTRTLWYATGAVTLASVIDYVFVGTRQLKEARAKQELATDGVPKKTETDD